LANFSPFYFTVHSWKPDGLYHYTGEGQRGDMLFRGGNKAIRDHAKNGKILLLFETLPNSMRRFVGYMDYVDYYYETISDQDGNLRKGIIFRLALVQPEIATKSEYKPSREANMFFSSRAAALEASSLSLSPTKQDSGRTYYQRSAQVAKYVLERANGFCEACGQPAPFRKPDGTPYLECHHIQRVSDQGPDHPSHIIACCPTCHKRIHHGNDGVQYNKELAEKVSKFEKAIDANKVLVVTAAIVISDDGKVLIAQKPNIGPTASKWEFPGGKVKNTETLEDCLIREIIEELGIRISILKPFLLVEHQYPHFFIRLFSFLVRIKSGVVSLNEHQSIKWVFPKELMMLDLSDADKLIANSLIKMKVSLDSDYH
jgi:mutator protein MutT